MDSSRLVTSAYASSDSIAANVSELFVVLRIPLYRYFLVGLGSPAEAEELTQECFLRLYRHLREGAELTDPRFWLFHVARNLVIDRNKSGRVMRELASANWSVISQIYADPSPTPEDRLAEKEKYEGMQAAFAELNEQQREILALKAEGFGYKEIAELMSLTTFAVAAHVRRAIAKIRTRMP